MSVAGEGGDTRRELAVARLRVIGDRAIRQVVTALGTAAAPDARVALLRVLEGRREAAVSAIVGRALEAPEAEVRAAAVAVARGLVDEGDAPDLLARLAGLAAEGSEHQDSRRGQAG